MTTADLDLLKAISFQLNDVDFSNERLARSVFHDGGNDMSDLTREDLESLIEGTFSGEWHRAAFSFSELLAYYRACDAALTDQQVVAWVFAAFVIADAIAHDAAEWEQQFDNFMAGFVIVSQRLEVGQSVIILRRVFGQW